MSEESKAVNVKNKNVQNLLTLLIVIAIVVYYISGHLSAAASLGISFLGLGIVIFIHELGHFIAGKCSGIMVEAFAIGFGPVVVGVKKGKGHLRFRFLPSVLLKDNDTEQDGLLCVKLPFGCKQGDTEYQLRIFPLGGFVKFLGQEDAAADKPSDDPRAFVNKSMTKRIITVSAGVFMNVVLAVGLFAFIYSKGINLSPAVVGDVIDGMPAARAGLSAGDEILEVDGKSNVDFSTVAMAVALSDNNEPVELKIKHTDGRIEDVAIIAEQLPAMGFKGIGITPPVSLEIGNVTDAEMMLRETGLKPGDVLTAVNGQKIEYFWQYVQMMKNIFTPTAELTFRREGQAELISFKDSIELNAFMQYSDDGKFAPACIGGFVPRLKVISALSPDVNELLKPGDVIIMAGDTANPNYQQLRQETINSSGREIAMTVLRDGELAIAKIKPRTVSGRVILGIAVGLDTQSTTVASVADANAFAQLPKGAQIKSIADVNVNNYYDIASVLKANRGKNVQVVYRSMMADGKTEIAVPADGDIVEARAIVGYDLPFKPMTVVYKAQNLADATKIGLRKTVEFLANPYLTIKGMLTGSISPKSLMGPVGMLAASKQLIAEKQFMQYLNFMAIISACLAVMNFLPLPILDGGYVLMAVIEKIKGSPISVKVQQWLVYVGLALIGGLFILITYNDILRVFFGR